jgi:hypothetical protein
MLTKQNLDTMILRATSSATLGVGTTVLYPIDSKLFMVQV